MIRRGVLAIVLALGPVPAGAAGPADPDWPCIQRRMPHLSLAQLWSGPAPDAAVEALAAQADVQALARGVSLRRTPMAEATARIDAYAEGRDAAALTALALAVVQHVDAARSRILEGITRSARKQVALDAVIAEKRAAFAAAEAAQDFDRMDAAEKEVDWSTRIFRDRQQSLTYVCETPVILEQRAFALLRAIAAHLPQ